MVTSAVPDIVKDRDPFSEDFLPADFVNRQQEIEILDTCLSGTSQVSLWVHGPPGSGKTSLVRKALGSLETQGVSTAYVNCFSAQTFYAVLDTIFTELRALVAEMRDVAFKYERLTRLTADKPLVVVLDEVDQMFLRERNTTLYNLARLDRVGIVCLSQSREPYLQLDPRVLSRFRPVFVEFSAYAEDQVMQILEARADAGLEPAAWCRQDLEEIAKESHGDARSAIQALRTAAYLAEKKRVPQIRSNDIRAGLRVTQRLRRNYLLKTLTEHHRLLFQIVKENPGVSLRDLWLAYSRTAKERKLPVMARRTFSHYKQYLVLNRLLVEQQGRGQGNTRRLRVVE